MPFLPSRRLLLLTAAAAALFLLSTTAALVADVLLLAAALSDALLLPPRDQVRATRAAPPRLALGAEAVALVTITNRSPHRLHLRLTDDLPAGLERVGPDVWTVEAGGGAAEAAEYRVLARERGRHAIGAVHIRVLGPLGLLWRRQSDEITSEVVVQPGLGEVRRWRLHAHQRRLRTLGMRAVRERGESTAFESLREYMPGDDPRRMDWKATARRGSYVVRQFEAERNQNVVIAMDAGRLMTEKIAGQPRLDHALAAALLLAEVARSQGDRVGLLSFAGRVQHFIPPGRSLAGRFADALSDVESKLEEPDYPGAFTFLRRQLQRRSLLVLFTDVIDARTSAALLAQLTAAGRRHLILAVTLRNTEVEQAATAPAGNETAVYRRAAAEELLTARARALATMQRQGILVADVEPHEAVPAVINRYLEVKRRALL